jgi:hypothetical protein
LKSRLGLWIYLFALDAFRERETMNQRSLNVSNLRAIIAGAFIATILICGIRKRKWVEQTASQKMLLTGKEKGEPVGSPLAPKTLELPWLTSGP